MAMKRLNFIGLRRSGASGKCFALAFLLVAMTLLSCINIGAQSDQVVARHMGAFYEAFLGRKLSGSELRAIVDAFIEDYTKEGKSRAAIDEIARSFDPHTKLLRECKECPAALTRRHLLIQVNYFQGVNATELRFLTEPDPIRVVGPVSKRLMTEKDVVALANLHNFSNSGGNPRHKELSRQEIERLVVELDRAIGTDPKSVRMPQFCTEAAALWAGIRQEWPRLSAEEKRNVRAYAGKGIEAYMPPSEMYARLLGLNQADATIREMNDLHRATLMIQEMGMMTTVLSRISRGLP
jgi:hypothetical protein